jgi:hypothetical protein
MLVIQLGVNWLYPCLSNTITTDRLGIANNLEIELDCLQHFERQFRSRLPRRVESICKIAMYAIDACCAETIVK